MATTETTAQRLRREYLEKKITKAGIQDSHPVSRTLSAIGLVYVFADGSAVTFLKDSDEIIISK